ncbi:MAG: tRNA pseudouridine(13) synthase TruD [Candidatus Aenigmatarchaeota archaeon]
MHWTKSEGTGGKIKERIEDFQVWEIPKQKPVSEKPEENEYTLFTLEKWNWDANRALQTLARALRVSIKRLGVAGTKDRRAVTRQRVSVWKIPEEQLSRVSIRGLKLSDFSKSSERIVLGDSEGNRFEVTIRGIELDEKTLKKRLEALFKEMEKGIPNVFGEQRFGTTRPVTALVGKALLKGDIEGACRIYLAKEFEGEMEDAATARAELNKKWGTKEGYLEALKLFPERLDFERSMLDSLSKLPTDFAAALRRLPKRLRKMFINAVQAEIWNKTVEKEWKNKPEQQELPLPGYDTVFDKKNKLHVEMQKIMEEAGITLKEFKLPHSPDLATTGGMRKVLLVPEELKLIDIVADEFNEGKLKATISFTLPAGAYATVVLAEIIK